MHPTTASRRANEPNFRKMDEIDEGYYELEMAKSNIKLDLPIQLGYAVLQLAKLRMLEFYYDFMDVYCNRGDFEYIEMDTDSAYMAISAKNIHSIVKPTMMQKYLHGINGFHDVHEVEADNDHHWFPRECCDQHAKMDKRTPGLFKVEFEGEEMIGLCSKTYMVTGEKGTKFSSKGINKKSVESPQKIFQKVLNDRETASGLNKGIRARNNSMYTYNQERAGFTYFYVKREVLSDGVHTKPLNIVLDPTPNS